ncbi:XdhC family protein [Aquisalimonas asiatica]|uniref:Xanthine dehydrogenase accessory factor n=1 Tax=Aquisalimonas asiatica TaxID=406100 RepID=A0A1H8SW61_9GAMM|nr:XdhC family protein [Aquisalimonas asiatica]SEO82564.1 xanthine dehydrogenase accessory factor [Aquisalimonas asiatica]
MKQSTIETLQQIRAAKRPAVLATRLTDGHECIIDPEQPDGLGPAARDAVLTDRSCPVEADGETWFLQVFNPPLRMLIIGGVHIAQHLSTMARQAGYDVTVIDPRAAFASPERFPGTALDHQWPDAAMAALAPDHRTAVVALTHDPKIDDPAIRAALESNAFYVGALGSRKTHAGRRDRLQSAGMDPAVLDRIHAPIGLDIGGRSPAEIALSIIAEVTQVLRRGGAR